MGEKQAVLFHVPLARLYSPAPLNFAWKNGVRAARPGPAIGMAAAAADKRKNSVFTPLTAFCAGRYHS
jgi:hypothetical protein